MASAATWRQRFGIDVPAGTLSSALAAVADVAGPTGGDLPADDPVTGLARHLVGAATAASGRGVTSPRR
jgi:hypothetical protein